MKFPQFSLAFGIAGGNENRTAAFELYQRAFGAIKMSETYPPDGTDLHITININGFVILLAPGDENPPGNLITCHLRFENEEDLRKAYDILIQEGENYWIGSYPWAKVGAHVTDRFNVSWWLFI